MRYIFIILITGLLWACAQEPLPVNKPSGPFEYSLLSLIDMDSLPSENVTITFADTSFSGQGPINRYFGQIADNRIGPVASTMMAGSDVLMEFEQKYFSALDAGIIEGLGDDTLFVRKEKQTKIIFIKK